MIGGYDPVRGANVVGHRGYYLTGPGLALNQALISYGLSFLKKRSYKLVQTPYMMRKDIMGKVAQLSEFDEALYKVRFPCLFSSFSPFFPTCQLEIVKFVVVCSPDESEAFD